MADKTVLLVDDSRVARMMVRKMIEQNRPGWMVVEAVDGEDGIAKFQAAHPDFVIMDVNMPGISGIEAARRIKAGSPDAVISLLTANIQEPLRLQAAELGLGFMSKPARDDALLAFLTVGAP